MCALVVQTYVSPLGNCVGCVAWSAGMQYRRLASWKGVVMVGCTSLDWWQEKQYARKVGEKKLLFPFLVVRCCWAAVLVLASFTMMIDVEP